MPVDIFEDPIPAQAPAPMQAPAAVQVPAPQKADRSASIIAWLVSGLLLCLCLLVALLLYGSPVVPDGGDDVDPPAPVVSGLHVLLLEESGERDKLTRDQAAIFTSIPLREWLKANCAQEGNEPAYRQFDKDDNLANETPIWKEMRGLVTEEPLVVLARDGKLAIQFKPASPDAMKERLEKFKANGK